ncbi:MAG: type II secretion system protein [Oscillospiraceae bacterium]|nr:type II secretion system protein [Oscillospiraceae bacterium]
MKSVRAFTLIELIVVIAIIGVLAAILVPSMIGYINDSKLSTANTNAKLVYDNAAIYCTQCEAAPAGSNVVPGQYRVDFRNKEPNMGYEKDGKDLRNALVHMMGGGNKAGIGGTVIADGGIAEVSYWVASDSDKCVGRYPGELTAKSTSDITTLVGSEAPANTTPLRQS